MIEVDRLSKQYGERTAVDGVSFTAIPGQILGFLGPNGAGKTTTMRIITGYLPASAGTVRVAGFDVFEQSFEVRKRVGYLPENPPLYDDMTVVPFLRFAAKIRGMARAVIPAAIERVVHTCALEKVADRMLGHLSKGFRQRVGLAQALIHEPEVLILDEPTNGLDPGQIDEMLHFIKGLAPDRTIVLSTHILGQVLQVCEKVVIISDGRVVVEDLLANLTRDQRLDDAYKRAIAGDGSRTGRATP
jgi:ABC-2 type transport system ATP-binding protein